MGERDGIVNTIGDLNRSNHVNDYVLVVLGFEFWEFSIDTLLYFLSFPYQF